MTPTTRLLKQKPGRRAIEAYLLVHGVMSRALSGGAHLDQDLGVALTRVLAWRRRVASEALT